MKWRIWLWPDKSALIVPEFPLSEQEATAIRDAWDWWRDKGAGAAVILDGEAEVIRMDTTEPTE